MYHFAEEFEKYTKRKAYKKKQHFLLDEKMLLSLVKRQIARAFSKKEEHKWQSNIKKYDDFEKGKKSEGDKKGKELMDVILQETIEFYKDKFKLYFTDQHLNLFCVKSTQSDDLFIYMFTNRRQINNMQSTLEVEVLKFDPDAALSVLE